MVQLHWYTTTETREDGAYRAVYFVAYPGTHAYRRAREIAPGPRFAVYSARRGYYRDQQLEAVLAITPTAGAVIRSRVWCGPVRL